MKEKNQSIHIFQRIEKKYLLSERKYKILTEILKSYMEEDSYGLHKICNIYYDTDDFDLIRRSLDKPSYKEKLRLRSYGIPTAQDTVFIELKKKWNGVVYKRRISMTLKEAENYLQNSIHPASDNQILHEIDYFISFYQPKPKLFLAYDRRAYCSLREEDDDLRITFDCHIRSRTNALQLSSGDYGTMLHNRPTYLMEIKAGNAYPLWLARLLTDLEIYPASFSKYGCIYQTNLMYQKEEALCSRVF